MWECRAVFTFQEMSKLVRLIEGASGATPKWRKYHTCQVKIFFFIRRQRKGREKALSKIQLGTFEEEEKEEEEGDLLHIRMK
jgi:hypothetical protein